jgi:hypothetical protein
MTKDQVKAVLEGVPTWPEDRQQELAEIAREIEAELSGASYTATPDELAAIDEGLAAEAASDEEVKAAFASFRQDEGRVFEEGPQRHQANRCLLRPLWQFGRWRTYRGPYSRGCGPNTAAPLSCREPRRHSPGRARALCVMAARGTRSQFRCQAHRTEDASELLAGFEKICWR